MLSVKKYQKSLSKDWDLFIQKSNNGTIFHTRSFLNYHIDRSFNDHSLCFYQNEVLICVLPAAIQKNSLLSHPGASYGGLILDTNLKFAIISDIIKLLEEHCILNKIISIFLIFSPSIYWEKYDASLEYILEYNNFHSKEIYISHATKLNIKLPIIDDVDKRKKRYIKNFLKNNHFQIIEHPSFIDSYGQDFYNILLSNKHKYSTKPTHSIDELMKLKEVFHSKIKFFISLQNNHVVGGSVIFITNKRVSLVFYNAVDNTVRKSQLAAYQLYYCSLISQKIGMKFIDFGVSHEPENKNPLSPKISLINFKEQFNASGVLRRAYKKDFDV